MVYFQLNNKEVFARIQELFLKRHAILMSYQKFAEEMGCNSFYASTSIFTGVQLYAIGLNSHELEKVDRTRWKKPKVSQSTFLRLSPLKRNKEFYKKYTVNFPKESFEYDEILKVCINENYNVLTKSGITLYFKKDSYFIISFKADEYTTPSDMHELTTAEFTLLTNQQDTHVCW